MMTPAVKALFAGHWRPLHNERRALVPLGDDQGLRYPGVYLLAYSSRPLAGRRVWRRNLLRWDVEFGGRSKTAPAAIETAIDGRNGHGPGNRFFAICARKKAFKSSRTTSRFFYATLTFPCVSRKSEASASDFREMGRVAQLEYDALAHVLEQTGKLPKLNDLAKDALDGVF